MSGLAICGAVEYNRHKYQGKQEFHDNDTERVKLNMSDFYCPICNVRKVSREGEICSSCQDPYNPVPIVTPTAQQSAMPDTASTNSTSDTSDETVTVASTGRRIMNTPVNSAPTTPSRRSVILPQQGVSQQAVQPAPAPQTVPIVPPVGTNQAQGTNAQPASGAITPATEGIVKNVTNSKDQANFLGRWFRSLLLGVPLARTDDITEFQVYSNWTGTSSNGGYSADKVVAYGNIVTGKPIQDNSVRVYGKRDKNRMIVASNIENTTDGTYSVFDPAPISATVVRVISFAIIAVIVLLVVLAVTGLSGRGGAIGQGAQTLLYSIVSAVAAVVSGRLAIRNFGKNWRNCGICALAALVFAYLFINLIGQIF